MPVRLGRFRLVPRHCGAKASPGAIRSSETAERSCWLSSPFRSACAGLNTEHAKGILGPEKIRPPWTNIDHTTGNHNRPGETAARMFFTRTKTTLARSAGSLGSLRSGLGVGLGTLAVPGEIRVVEPGLEAVGPALAAAGFKTYSDANFADLVRCASAVYRCLPYTVLLFRNLSGKASTRMLMRKVSSKDKIPNGLLRTAVASGVAVGLATASLGGIGTASGTCIGISGINIGEGCDSSFGNFALGLGEGTVAVARDGFINGAIAIGTNVGAFAGVPEGISVANIALNLGSAEVPFSLNPDTGAS